MVLEQGAGDGVFDGHDAHEGRVAVETLHHLVERVTLHRLNIPGAEICAGGGIVEASGHALYGHFEAHLCQLLGLMGDNGVY